MNGDEMGPISAFKYCSSRTLNFTSRSSRSEFWYFHLGLMVIGILLSAMSVVVASGNEIGVLFFVTQALMILYFVWMQIASLAVQVRRLHDINKSGWWVFLALIPLVGTIVLIVWYCKSGDLADNVFGNAPLRF